jgi:HTH-type transcriptional regulator/antitoxin HigA
MSAVTDSKNDRYLELVIQFPLRPLRSDGELDEAIRIVDSLLSQKALTPEEGDYLEVLSDLVERYENEAHPMPTLSDGDMLTHLLEARGIASAELAQGTGIAPAIVEEVIARGRALNREQVGKIARFFHVPPAVFVF